jgi:hypothetical protein
VADFLRVLRFPLKIFIPPISPQSPSPIIRGWYNRPVVAAVPKVPPHKLKIRGLSPQANYTDGARSSVVGCGTMLQAGRLQVRFSSRSLGFLNDLILPAALWPCGRVSLYQK